PRRFTNAVLSVWFMSPEERLEEHVRSPQEDRDEDRHLGPDELALVTPEPGPEVLHDDPGAVQGVEEHAEQEEDLQDARPPRLVQEEELVEDVWPEPDQEDVEDVHQQEEDDPHPGGPVQQPGKHTFPAAVTQPLQDRASSPVHRS